MIYATDEDVAVIAAGDFPILCPRDQKLAAAADGTFAVADRWKLKSDSVNFSSQGIAAGHVVQLLTPASQFRPPGELMVVDIVAGDGVVLRRKGEASLVGQPPAPATGIIGVEFLIATLGPQLESASYELSQRFGIDESLPGRRASDLFDARELRDATVLVVMYQRYLDLSHGAPIGGQDALAAKALRTKARLDEVVGRLGLRWSSTGSAAALQFGTRICR